MKFNKKGTVITLMAALGLTSLLAVSPTYAHHHYHGGGGGVAAGMFFGAALGMVAGAAMSHPDYGDRGYYDDDDGYYGDDGYGPGCQREYVRHCDDFGCTTEVRRDCY